MTKEKVSTLELSLHDEVVGYLLGYEHGKNVFKYDANYIANPNRNTFTLTDKIRNEEQLKEPKIHRHQLAPVLSNLLPEGSYKELVAKSLKVHENNEFPIFSALGKDLPGALIATPMETEEIPKHVFDHRYVTPILTPIKNPEQHFSLAGVQIKFSMKNNDGRFTIGNDQILGDWIIKTPSIIHPHVPQNEYTIMRLAEMVGIEIPEIDLIDLKQLDNLPKINLPDNEDKAFAIKRFDRSEDGRIHTEDFAQVFEVYPTDKYEKHNYENIGKVLYESTKNPIGNAQELAKRLLVNILLGNGDAHLKNWSLIYRDKISAELSPAYDIVFTKAYMKGETEFALNLNKTKEWYSVSMEDFRAWSKSASIDWRVIKPQLESLIEQARETWAEALLELPMVDDQKALLKEHWGMLSKDFRI